ncbi:MAG: hypothetical protein HS109_10825 [Burkholderiales bacterium]|nr:hypothetical protein [Burkholderiales bacterium]
MFGIDADQMRRLSDDRIGRALDRLFDADRAALLTEVVVAVGRRFGVTFDRPHDDSTSVAFCGRYRAVAGRSDFLYVADPKLCSYANMQHIDAAGGRFVTVMPRSRQEDARFRKWIQSHTPDWELVRERPNVRHADGPRDCWYVYRPQLSSMEGWPIPWVWSTLLTLQQRAARDRRVAAATEQLEQLHRRLAGARARLRGAAEIDRRVQEILEQYRVARYLKVQRVVREEHSFKQARRGRPGPDTAYRRITLRRFDIEYRLDEDAVAYDRRSDGMCPLLSNHRNLTAAQVLEAHKGRSTIEKRFEQVKTVREIAPVFLKNEGRIEASRHTSLRCSPRRLSSANYAARCSVRTSDASCNRQVLRARRQALPASRLAGEGARKA